MPCSTGRAAHCITAPGCQEDGEPYCPCIRQSAFSASPFKGDLIDNKVVDQECVIVTADLCQALRAESVNGTLSQTSLEQFISDNQANLVSSGCQETISVILANDSVAFVIGTISNDVYISNNFVVPFETFNLRFTSDIDANIEIRASCDGLNIVAG